ncbi:MAG TPA: hypothetical protein VK988_22735 [Acidimicrobiales bacterium]|nr:hypothetical protein [Acidimicrobiales bacterium]
MDRLPAAKHRHHLADYVELLCLTNADLEFSSADLVDRLLERSDVGEDATEEGDEPEPGEAPAAREDRLRRIAEDTFTHLAYRQGVFGRGYPFRLEGDNVLRRVSQVTRRRKLYVFLLLASSLRYVNRTPYQSQLEKSFERLATEALRRLLPSDAEVHPFGTAASGGRYRGRAWLRYERLAKDLRDHPLLEETNFPINSVGDLGLDSVAWLPSGDDIAPMMTFFAQSTCTVEWRGKQSESRRWETYLHALAPRGNFLFVPFCFRLPNGQWYDLTWVYDGVVIDRLRLLWIFRGSAVDLEEVPYDLVDASLAQREALV